MKQISTQLKNLFLLSIPLFIIHGLEEYNTNLSNTDALATSFFTFFSVSNQQTFLLFQFMWWILLLTTFVMLLGQRWQFLVMTLFGLVFLFELHHLVQALILFDYYPGLFTALLLSFVGFFFWKELLLQYKVIA